VPRVGHAGADLQRDEAGRGSDDGQRHGRTDARGRHSRRAGAGEDQPAVCAARRGGLEEPERAGDERGGPARPERARRVAGQIAAERASEVREHARRRADEDRWHGDQQHERKRRAQLLAGEGGHPRHPTSQRPPRSS
jgi:hypothetical protein